MHIRGMGIRHIWGKLSTASVDVFQVWVFLRFPLISPILTCALYYNMKLISFRGKEASSVETY
jgi:hypothetical protein